MATLWSKFGNVLKARPGTPGPDADDERAPDVLAGVYEQHPNLSVFQQDVIEQPFPTSSPPASPSRSGRRNMFKRMSKIPPNENVDTISKNTFSKKVLSPLQTITSDYSLGRVSTDNLIRQSQDSQRPSLDSLKTPSTPTDGKGTGETKFGSLRSILKPNNAPGTGQSVRFFSRDAYRVISPDQSSASEFDDPSLLNRMQRSTSVRPSAQSVFTAAPPPPATDEPSTPGVNSMIYPIPPPELGNIFDLSSEELPTIPPGYAAPLLDSAIEISEGEEKSMSLDVVDDHHDSEDFAMADVGDVSPTVKIPGKHDRSQSFSFGQSLLQSLAESSPAIRTKSPPNRHRALSDTNIFTSMIQSPSTALPDFKPPEADINDTSNAVVTYQSPERDPFAANAMTYYTPGTMLPPSPPQSNHTRTASREEDIIWSLRTQLALQQELCAQYEVDLAARDEAVEMLNARLSDSDKELDRRRNMIRSWRKRVAELEKCVRGLEDEVDRSREESMDRSVMDEASSEALRMLQRRIGELEREKKERESREENLREQVTARTEELEKVKDELQKRDKAERELKAGIKAAKDEMELMGEQPRADEELRSLIAKSSQSAEELTERHRSAESSWEHERTELLAINDTLRNEQVSLQSQLTTLREEVVRKEEDLAVLKAELEAQWKHSEQHSEEVEKLRQDKDELAHEAEALREKLSRAEVDWDDDEGKKADLEAELEEAWALKDDLGRERDELERQLQAEQEHAEELTRALQEREDRVSNLEQECQFAMDSVKRLQENIRQRDAEISDHIRRIKESETEADDARESLTKQKRDHSRTVDEQSRRISEVVAREVEARAAMEQLVKDKAEADVQMSTLKERVNALTQELERLRRQVHELQQESADKEVKLVQCNKQVNQLKEDKNQLNISLEAKQQEVEMMKRSGIVSKAAVGATPATRAPFRRESSIFGTPGTARPPSALSDASSTGKERKAVTIRPSASAIANRRADQSMGPPSAIKARPSLTSTASATPSRLSTNLARSSSLTPIVKTHRRPSSSLESLRNKNIVSSRDSNASVSTVSEQETENADVTPVAIPKARRASVAVPS
ncbi:hypothetical protein BC835DRAFT_1414411 [Cytidiella melzeri]|nr:hypothetical protein BC835DRAFT_1414411 [Cytidiella melzeri]